MPPVSETDTRAGPAAGTGVATRPPREGHRTVKHVLDRVLAVFGLVVTAPLLAGVALALRVHGGTVLERERRVGEGGRPVVLLSFAITDEMCRTRRWRLLAGAGVPALPQLWNVVRGDLSIVWPRPRSEGWAAPPSRPGLTGLAQLCQLDGELDDSEQIALDDEYARTWSLRLDARIVARTLLRVLR